MIIADSDILIDALRGQQPAIDRISMEIKKGTLATTTINVFELLSGAKTPAVKEKVDLLIEAIEIFPLDQPAGTRAAAIRRELEQKGMAIGMADYLIAGICLERSVSLLTRNRNHFERVPGLIMGDL